MKKKLLMTIICALSASILIGCGNKQSEEISNIKNEVAALKNDVNNISSSAKKDESNTDTNSEKKDQSNADTDSAKKETIYSTELSKFVLQGNAKQFVRSYLDTTPQTMTCTNEYEINDAKEKVYEYKAELKDKSNTQPEAWASRITIRDYEMVESNPLSSIVKNKVQLKLPLEVGNKWEQSVEVDGKEYTMKHEIIEISETQNRFKNICVKSTIDNFNNSGTYIEAAIYQEGTGIVASDRISDDGQHGESTFALISTVTSSKDSQNDKSAIRYYSTGSIDINKAFAK
ncbi:MAG: hypothetical protein Q4F66_00795 [Clostridium sp.]|nr:hypothetical protein [Clostridium sp.]